MGVTLIAAGIAAAASVYSAQSAKSNTNKAIQAQKDAANASKVDINALNDQTKSIATQNAIDSANLEKQLTPEVPILRQQANQGVIDSMNNNDPGIAKGKALLEQGLGVPLNTPLLNSAIAKAQSDLALGGKLSQDTQNLATRKAAATAGGIAGPGGGLGLGRDLTARDLGLTSTQLEQQRLQNASQLGGQELNQQEANQSNLLNSLNALRAIHDTKFNQYLSAAQYGQSIRQPNVGLDPTAAANIAVGNSNAAGAAASNQANIYGQQANNNARLAGQALGYGYQAWNSYNTQNTAANAPYASTATVGSATSPYAMNVTYSAPSGCWIAREVYGEMNPRWTYFRYWMMNVGPDWFRRFYFRHGPAIAKWLKNHPALKPVIRIWMNSRINTLQLA